jgi:hypothetical protein
VRLTVNPLPIRKALSDPSSPEIIRIMPPNSPDTAIAGRRASADTKFCQYALIVSKR